MCVCMCVTVLDVTALLKDVQEVFLSAQAQTLFLTLLEFVSYCFVIFVLSV